MLVASLTAYLNLARVRAAVAERVWLVSGSSRPDCETMQEAQRMCRRALCEAPYRYAHGRAEDLDTCPWRS
jgi:hypothetical protein